MSHAARSSARAVLALVVMVAFAMLVLAPVSAQAAARVTISNEFGKAQADLTYSTTVTVSGTGFQSIKGGFGGIYVLFGAVYTDDWQPSKGGSTGAGDYEYVPDSESKDNQGFQKFVSFPGSETESSANGGLLEADGTWSTPMVIPGSTFQAEDRDGNVHTVDCQKVTCGIITIGAHGVVNEQNETFTPVSFASIYDSAPTAGASSTATATQLPSTTATSDASTAPEATTDPAPAASPEGTTSEVSGAATATVDRQSAYPGRALAFSGTGFVEGDQVVAVLDDGAAAVGPLTAARGGALAGVLQLPAETTVGTHTLRLLAASTGATATVSFPVRAATAVVPDDGGWPSWLPSWPVLVFVLLALLALVAVLLWRWRAWRTAKGPAGKKGSAGEKPSLEKGAVGKGSQPSAQDGSVKDVATAPASTPPVGSPSAPGFPKVGAGAGAPAQPEGPETTKAGGAR